MISVSQPFSFKESKEYVIDAIDGSDLSGHGKYVRLFEEEFSRYTGSKYSVMVSSGTVALFLAIQAKLGSPNLDRKAKRYRILIPNSTLISPLVAAALNGHDVVLADVDPNTWCLPEYKFDNFFEYDAVIPTHIYSGNPCLRALLDSKDKIVIEDCAEAIGSKINGNHVGSFGSAACYSLYANKTITSGEGGVITTNDEDLYLQIRDLRNLGLSKASTPYNVINISMNFRPSNLQAAFALGQLRNIEVVTTQRKVIDELYRKLLNPDYFRFQKRSDGCYSTGWYVAVLLQSKDKVFELKEHLFENGIETRTLFPPLSSISAVKMLPINIKFAGSAVSQDIFDRGIILPSAGPNLTPETIVKISNVCNEFMKLGK